MAMHNFIPNMPFFSPEGRLYDVEYAMEEVAKAIPIVAILANDGIVVAAEQEGPEPLMIRDDFERIFFVNHGNVCVTTGKMDDAYTYVSAMLDYSRRHRETYGEQMPTERLVELSCNKKQSYTMYIGKQPLCISVIYIGWDSEDGWKLFKSDPSGNFSGWNAVCIGRNAQKAQDFFNKNLIDKPLPSMDTALEMAIKALKVAMGDTELNAANVQMLKLYRGNETIQYKVLGELQVQELCQKYSAEL